VDLNGTINLLTLLFAAGGGALGAIIAMKVWIAKVDIKLEAIDKQRKEDREQFTAELNRVHAAATRAHARIDAMHRPATIHEMHP